MIKSMEKRIAKNSLWLVVSQVIGRLIGFGYFIFLARKLSVENFGIYAWVLGFIYNFFTVADFGLERYILKHLPRHPERRDEYFSRLLGAKLILAGITFLLTLILAPLMNLSGQTLQAYLVFTLVFFPYAIYHLIIAFRNAQEKVITGVIGNLAFTILGAILGVLAIRLGGGVTSLFVAYLAGLSITALGLLSWAKKIGLPLKPVLDRETIQATWRECRFFAVLAILGNFYLRLPLVITGRVMGDYWSGIYGSISKFLEAGVLIPQAISLAFAPTFSRLLLKNKKQLKKLYRQLGGGVFALSLLVTLFFFTLGGPFLTLIYGERYLPALPALKILGLVIPLFFFNYLAGNIIENSSRVKKFVPWAGSHFGLVFVLTIIFTKQWGITGAATGLLVGEIARFFLNRSFIKRILG